MSERQWTAAQRKAIDFEGKNLILSAAAGSGKSSTLTQRIIELLQKADGSVGLDRMLIVTFTKAAAGELKQKIGDALSKAIENDPENKHIIRQLTILEGARISTIHSFFKTELEPYAVSLGLSPDFRVLDEAEASVLMNEAMRDTADHFFALNTESAEKFERLIDDLSTVKNESGADNALIGIRDALDSKGIYGEAISAIAEELERNADDVCRTSYYDDVKKYMREGAWHFYETFEGLSASFGENEKTAFYVAGAQSLADYAAKLYNGVCNGTYREIKSYLDSFKMERLKSLKQEYQTDAYIRYKECRTSFVSFLATLKDCFGEESENMPYVCKATAENMHMLAQVLNKFEEIYSSLKKEAGGVDFGDLEKLALKVFCNGKTDGTATAAALETGKKFDYIFIDEYQDTNTVQDAVFRAVSGECGRFMVGDVKQSIYSFRGACPSVFTSYREKYEKGDGGSAVFMSENFRSDRGIIDFANIVSSYIFSAGAAPFEAEDRLVCAKQNAGNEKCEIRLVEKDPERPSVNLEAEYVADRIAAMLCESGDGEKLKPCDFAVLLRNSSHADDYVRALASRGVAAENRASEELFSYSEVLLIMCLLNSADNPLRDVYLAGAMKSPLFGFSLGELVKIRGADRDPLWYSVTRYADGGAFLPLREKCRDFACKINSWRYSAREMTADEIFRTVINDSGLLLYEGDTERSVADISRSVKQMGLHARKVAQRGGGLHELVSYLNSLIEKKDKSIIGGEANSVVVLTVHRSKGLEYPVCFLSECAHGFNLRDADAKTIVSEHGEIAMKLYDDSGLVRCDTPLRGALSIKSIMRGVDEEARILYVALTRARNKLIITCKTKDAEAELTNAAARAKEKLSAYTVNSSRNFARWIIDAAMRNVGSGCFDIRAAEMSHSQVYVRQDDVKKEESSGQFDKFFENAIDTDNNKEYLQNIPAKLSVSKLHPDLLNIDGDEKMFFDGNAAVSMPEKMSLPVFLREAAATPADKGTATHLFMQFCDWQSLSQRGTEHELMRLCECGFISEHEASLVNVGEIELFRNSVLFRRLLDAKEILREKRFNASVCAADFTTNSALAEKLRRDGVTITVQGVIDCMFTDKDGKTVLVDYKTDRLTAEELADRSLAAKKLKIRHSRQLSMYRDICESMLGITFDEVCIYSLPLGDVIDIER